MLNPLEWQPTPQPGIVQSNEKHSALVLKGSFSKNKNKNDPQPEEPGAEFLSRLLQRYLPDLVEPAGAWAPAGIAIWVIETRKLPQHVKVNSTRGRSRLSKPYVPPGTRRISKSVGPEANQDEEESLSKVRTLWIKGKKSTLVITAIKNRQRSTSYSLLRIKAIYWCDFCFTAFILLSFWSRADSRSTLGGFENMCCCRWDWPGDALPAPFEAPRGDGG